MQPLRKKYDKASKNWFTFNEVNNKSKIAIHVELL